jgi:DNA replication protein DnaC
MNPKNREILEERARRLGLHGLLARWSEIASEPWLERVIEYEEQERQKRGLERRIRNARLGRFKSMADFDWHWPKKIDREAIDELFTFDFLQNAANVVFVGPNGVGKSMISQNIAHQAALRGESVRFVSASDMLNDLAAQGSEASFARRLRRYVRPRLLVIDEVGYLSYDTRHADLLFEVVTRRYEQKSIVLTTNKPFGEWNEVFPNASCVVTLVDRLVHRAEIITVEGESYRFKEAKERAAEKAKARQAKRRNHSKQLTLSAGESAEAT